MVGPAVGSGLFPGQAGNPVGFAAAPGFTSLTAWPGGTGQQTISDGTNSQSGSGTALDPWVFKFFDFNSGTGGVDVTASHVKFIGCRFQSNQVAFYNVSVDGIDQTYSYCSFTPLASLYTSPPGAAWPSAGAGLQTITQVTDVNCIGGNSGYQVGLSVASAGPLTADHCDFWGGGNSGSQGFLGTTAQMTFTDCWIHDAPNAAPQTYHQDGIGFVNGTAAPSNILIQHCTIASIGNTNALAMQSASTPYSFINVINNYFSGFGLCVDMCHDVVGNNNMAFTDNIFGTDVCWVFGPLYTASTSLWTGTTNLWRRNKLAVLAGTAPISGSGFAFTSADNNKFILPDSSLSVTDWTG